MLFAVSGANGNSGTIALFFSKEHLEHAVTVNALSLSLSASVSREDLDAMNGKYVLVEGRFDQKATGHMGVYSAGLVDVNRVDVYDDLPASTDPD